MPARLTRPTVGLTLNQSAKTDGQTMEPSVSVPNSDSARLAEPAEPEPAAEPQGCDRGRKGCEPDRRARSIRWKNALSDSWPTR